MALDDTSTPALSLRYETGPEGNLGSFYFGGRMPQKAKRPCRHPGCKELTTARYCAAHAEFEPKYIRPQKIHARYDATWRKIRNRFIAKNPLCVHCLKQGKYTPAEEVDHILPLQHGGTHDETNLQALCKRCHSKKTALDGDRWKKKVYSYEN